ncbi:hypothetical protein [Bradyrhizobium sp. ARR65]|uniref:hypothetical protein n=1 Tax=Bradyrhizobium sp. ARR65 TaxID=1040989 RepID=UPI000465BE55|nr:hypothetical protein [Bradyrhizobium sp. ARR65]
MHAFIIRPFGLKKDTSGETLDFDRVQAELIVPAIEQAAVLATTIGEIVEVGNIREDMFSRLLQADIVICDITIHDTNVFYELGIRHALRKKSTIMIRGNQTADGTPFDLLTDRYLAYDIHNPRTSLDGLVSAIKGALTSVRGTDSPILQLLPNLQEADPFAVQRVSVDLLEEIVKERARVSSTVGDGSDSSLRIYAIDLLKGKDFGELPKRS